MRAARQWKFKALSANREDTREWVLWFAFRLATRKQSPCDQAIRRTPQQMNNAPGGDKAAFRRPLIPLKEKLYRLLMPEVHSDREHDQNRQHNQ